MQRAATRARDWLLNVAAPLWAGRGRTASGLFAERMTLSGVPDATYFRTFVQARHIFSFIEAGKIGWTGPWRALVGETVDTLLTKARRADGFFVHRLTGDAAHLDGRADLYDQAFILLALAKAGEALDRPTLFDEAERLLDLLQAEWAHPLGGFTEGELVDPSVRRQNPHMHLFEAFIALAEASKRQRFMDAAVTIGMLCKAHFIDSETGALLEYFKDDWTPADGLAGRIVEPGHCLEWAWLFETLALFGWADSPGISDHLTHFARSTGICARRRVTINEVLTDGTTHNGNARLWPQTERTKAAVARYRRLGSEEEASEAAAAAAGLDLYLDVVMPGLWRDKLTPEGGWIDELAPGSSLYHISCAYGELARIAL
ncbi:AGE family epimerase/isomerase [Sphingobium sp. RSMS]|uniref:AGE family epimerase/isomerase n=1 Tax=Sphingobium sp. RSMS TaxID=520734 RepID=UPI0010F9894E|nr:AGE family epimerase/isomerase [Sphingobium sp. RSMS]